MGRGLAEVEPNMVNLSGPPANFSKCYENSVPNPGVLAIPLQQQYQDRECCRKIKDPNVAPYTQPCRIIGRQTGLTVTGKQNNTKCRSVKT